MVTRAISSAIKKAAKDKQKNIIKIASYSKAQTKTGKSKTKKPDLMTSEKAKKMVGTKGGYKTKSKRAAAKTKGRRTEFERGTAATAKRGSIAKSPIGFNKIKTAKEFTKANNRLRALGNRVGPLSKAEQAEVKRLKKLVADYKKMRSAEATAGSRRAKFAGDARRKNKSKITLAAPFKPK